LWPDCLFGCGFICYLGIPQSPVQSSLDECVLHCYLHPFPRWFSPIATSIHLLTYFLKSSWLNPLHPP
jgi:hypothetical protein